MKPTSPAHLAPDEAKALRASASLCPHRSGGVVAACSAARGDLSGGARSTPHGCLSCLLAGDVAPALAPVPAKITPEWKDRVNACPHRECRSGCERTVCRAGKGDRWHQVWVWECVACLKGT